MRLLVIGNGGREHALVWKLQQSPQVDMIFCAPGNGGTGRLKGCENLPLPVTDLQGISDFASQNPIDLVVVGPEVPLALGLTDHLRARGVAVFGPTQAGAQLESSKTWAKQLMETAGVPTARAASFTDPTAASDYVRQQGVPIVVKADGLAAGKGVTVATTVAEALAAIDAAFAGVFGTAGQRVLIEECLQGQEVSLLALTDGITMRPLLPAQDHKRIGEGDTGANTGGMGAYAPVPLVTPELLTEIQQQVLEPVLKALRDQGIDYRGVLYAGLMVTPTGEPKVIEFNCRFGDPETQVVLPLLESPLAELLLACAEQRLEGLPPLVWKPEVAACVVMAAGGYPGDYQKDLAITGLEAAENQGALVFHAGTKLQAGELVSDGGRVLNVVATGQDFATALAQAYRGIDCIQFPGAYYRRDIGYRVLGMRS